MEEENVTPASEPESAPEGASAETEKPDKGQQEHMIPKSRFDEVNNELKKLRDNARQAEEARKAAEAQALAEQGKFKDLWEKAQSEAEQARSELLRVQQDALRREVATQAGYPALWNRLSGETEEELKADMATLAESLPKAQAPDLAGSAGTNERGPRKSGMTKAEKLALAGILGVNPDYIP